MMRLLIATVFSAVLGWISPARAASPPPQAVASGYTQPVLIDNFKTDTFGVFWFPFNRDNPRWLTVGSDKTRQAYIANGTLTIQTDTSGYGSGLQSISSTIAPTSTPTHPIFAGSRLFLYGYYEARLKFDPHGYTGRGDGWPAFWAGSMSRDFPHSELDFLEAQPDRHSGSSVITSTIHEWKSATASQTNGKTRITPPDDFDPGGFNTYGCLWTPTSITFYINNHIAVMPGASNPTPIGPGTAFPSAVADGHALILGTGFNWSVVFEFVHVWQ
jgi:hypothetical protein